MVARLIRPISLSQANVSDGLRAACASTAMLLVGDYLHSSLFAWAAIGAFWTCLAKAAGSSARRFLSMASFSLLSTIAGGATAYAAGLGEHTAAVSIMVFVFAAGLSTIYSASTYLVAILVATACVVMVDHPLHGVTDGVSFLATYLTGCVFAMLLSFPVWRFRPSSSALSVHIEQAAVSKVPPSSPSTAEEDGVDVLPSSASSWTRTAMRTVYTSLATMRVNMTMRSPGMRHAARLTVATTGAFLVERALRLPYGYWATMATLLVMHPSIRTTLSRAIERSGGTTIGAALAIAIGQFAHTSAAQSLAVFPLVCLTITLRKVNYGLFVIFLTPTFVLVANLALPADEVGYAFARFGNNVIGALLALIATYILWPNRNADDLSAP